MSKLSPSFLKALSFCAFLVLISCSGGDSKPLDAIGSDALTDLGSPPDSSLPDSVTGDLIGADVAGDVVEPPLECEVDEDCVSELACQVGLCDLETATCTFDLVENACLVDGVCYLDGAVDENDFCQFCASVVDTDTLLTQPCPPNQQCDSASGECRCAEGYEGDNCAEPICTPACSENGSCTSPDVCTCLPGFSGEDCSVESSVECSDKGFMDADGLCQCSEGYAGPACEFSDDETCFSQGSAKDDGSCECVEGYTGDDCATALCVPECGDFGNCIAPNECECFVGFGGSDCSPLVEGECSDGGIPNDEGDCDCSSGFAGISCEFSNLDNCSGTGEAQWDGSCICDLGYAGDDCSECVHPDGCLENLYQPLEVDLSGFELELGSCWAIANGGSLGPDDYLECDTSQGFFGEEAIAWSEEIGTQGSAQVYVQLTLAWSAPEEGTHTVHVLASSNTDDPSKTEILDSITVSGENTGSEHLLSLSSMMAAQPSIWIGIQVDTDSSETLVVSFDDVKLASDATDFGCMAPSSTQSCALPQGMGQCFEGDCLVTECGPNYYDLNLVHEDGCEYSCFGEVGADEGCNGLDDDCDGVVDEDCSGEQLDDSWFGGLITNVVTWGDVSANTFEVGAEGIFQGGPLGGVKVTGTVSQGGATDPVIWCFTGMKSFDLLGLSFSDVAVEVCRDSDGEVITTLNGFVLVEGNNAEFTGTLEFKPSWKLVFQIEDLPLGGILTLNKAKFTVSKGGSQYNLSANMNIDDGPNPVTLKVSGAYYTTGTINLSVALDAEEAWYPIPGSSLNFTEVDGKLKRKTNSWSVELAVLGGFTLPIAPGFSVEATSFAGTLKSNGDWSFALGGDVEMGPLGTVSLLGSLNKGDEEVPLWGCLSATKDQSILGLEVEALGVEACVTEEGTHTVTISGDAIWGGESHPFVGTVEKDGDFYAVALQMGNLTLAPGVVVNDVVLSATSGSLNFAFSGNLTVEGMTLLVSGSYSGPDSYDLSLSVSDMEWTPFDFLDMTFTSAAGSISRSGDVFEFGLETTAMTDFTLTEGLTLTDVSAGLALDTEGNFSASLSGDLDVTMGDSNTVVRVTGTANSDGVFSLTGMWEDELQPLEWMLGPDRLVMTDTQFTFEVDTQASYSVAFSTTAEICYELDGCNFAKPPFTIIMDGAIVDGTDFFVRGNLPEYELPGFGILPDITVIAASTAFPDMDIHNTPDDTSDDEDIEEGITLVVLADNPLPAFEEVETLEFFFNMKNFTEISIKAKMGLDWQIFGPDVIPTIDYLKLVDLYVKGKIEGAEAEIGVGADAEFLPNGQTTPIEGTAEFSIDTMGAAEVTMYLDGRWVEPFGLERFAIQNPGFTVEALFSTGIPTPSSLGVNGDIFWQKPGTMEWPPESDDLEDAPDGILKLGGTIFYDKTVTQSGLCLVKPCPSMPPFLFRLDIQNLSPSDTIDMINDLRNSMVDALGFGDFLPEQDISGVELSVNDEPTSDPLITFDTLKLYASTHNKIIFGQKWNSGFKVEIDATVLDKDVYFRGELSRKGLVLHGQMDPFALDAGQFLQAQIVGDPYRKYANIGSSGMVSVADDSSFDIVTGTYEGWIKPGTLYDFPIGAVLMEKGTESGGFAVGVGSPDESGGKVTVAFSDGTVDYMVTTDEGHVNPGQWHHLAVNFNQGDIAIFVDGDLKASTGSGIPIAPVFNSGDLNIGTGMLAVDDVRIWNTVRTRDQIAGNARILPIGFHQDPELIARYEFDYDGDGGTTAHNSRLYPPPESEGGGEPWEIPGGGFPPGIPSLPDFSELQLPLHGSYEDGASSQLELDDQDLYFKLVFTFPEQGEANGLWLQAGIDMSMPFLDYSIMGKSQVQLGDGNAFGSIYFGDLDILPIPYLGTFFLGGDGPNMFPNDFDDGLYAAFDLKELSFMGVGTFGFQSDIGDQDRKLLGGASVSFMCPAEISCESAWEHEFHAMGFVDLTAEMPGGFGNFGLEGDALLDSKVGVLRVNGSLQAFSHEFLSGEIELNSEGAFFQAGLDLSADTPFDIGSLDMGLSLEFEGPTLCGNSNLIVNVPLIDGGFDGLLEFCAGANDLLIIDAQADDLTFFGFGLNNGTLYYNSVTNAAEIAAEISLPIWSGSLYASYDGDSDVVFTASSELSLLGFTLADADLTLSSLGFGISGSLNLLGSSVSVSGDYKPTGDWRLNGTGTLGLGGYELSNASVEISNVGVSVSANLNLGPLNVDLMGSIESDGSYIFTGSQDLTIAGYTLTGASVSLSNTQGVQVSGMISVLGSSVSVSGSVTPSGGVTLTGVADINLLSYPIADASILLTNTKLKAAGDLQILGASLGVNIAISASGSFSVSGNTTLTVKGYTITNANFSLTQSSLSLNGVLQAGAFQAQMSGSISPLSGINLYGTLSLGFFGDHELANMSLNLNDLGLSASGKLDVGIIDTNMSGSIETNGNYEFTANTTVKVPLLDLWYTAFDEYINLVGASVTLSNTSGLTIAANAGLSSIFNASFTGGVTPNGSFRLDASTELTFPDGAQNWVMGAGGNASVSIFYCKAPFVGVCSGVSLPSNSGGGKVEVSGSVSLLGNTVAMSGHIRPGSWSITASHSLNIGVTEYELMNSSITLSKNDGLEFSSTLGAPNLLSVSVSGSANPNGSFVVESSAGVSYFDKGWSPTFKGKVTLSGSPKTDWPYYQVGVSADASFSFHGFSASGSFSMNTSGTVSFSASTSVSANPPDFCGDPWTCSLSIHGNASGYSGSFAANCDVSSPGCFWSFESGLSVSSSGKLCIDFNPVIPGDTCVDFW